MRGHHNVGETILGWPFWREITDSVLPCYLRRSAWLAKHVGASWQKQMDELHQGLSAPLTWLIFPFVKKYVLILLLLMIAPVSASAANYLLGDRRGNWQTADRSSAGLLPKASQHPDTLIRIYAARTVRWRGIFAVHTWIVVKERGASRYSRYDYTAWGEPIRVDGFAPDGRWFGAVPETVVSVDG